MPKHIWTLIVTTVASMGGAAHAGVVYLTQDRTISAETSSDGNVQSLSAPDFSRFQEAISLATEFVGADGTDQPNEAGGGIDCQLDPNAILVGGSLFGAGGFTLTGGDAVTGEAAVRVLTSFEVTEATPFQMRASARPSASDRDRFKIKLEDTIGTIFMITQDDPAQEVDLAGLLPVGVYTLEYQAELTIDGPLTLKDYYFQLSVPAPGGALAGVAGLLAAARRRR